MSNALVPMVEYSSVDMAVIYQESFLHLLNNLGEADKIEVLKYTVDVISENTFLTGSPEDFAVFTDNLFSNLAARDFVLMLQRIFFGRWVQGRGEGLINAMVYDLAVGLTISPMKNAPEGHKLVTEQIAQTIPKMETVIELLSNNLWFVTVMLMPLFLNLDDIEKQVPSVIPE